MSTEHDPGTVVRRDGSVGMAARGYRWPTATAGNTIALKHGAWSPRKVDPLAEEIIEAHRPAAEWWTPADEPAIQAWGRTEARIQLLTEWLLERGSELTDDGDTVGASNLLTKLEKLAEGQRSKLGLDPLSRAKLGRDVAAGQVDMARLMAEESKRAFTEAGDDA